VTVVVRRSFDPVVSVTLSFRATLAEPVNESTARAQGRSADNLRGSPSGEPPTAWREVRRANGLCLASVTVANAKQKPRRLANAGGGVASQCGEPVPAADCLAKAQPGRLQAGFLAPGSSSRRAFPSPSHMGTVASCGGRRRSQRRVRGRFPRPSLLGPRGHLQREGLYATPADLSRHKKRNSGGGFRGADLQPESAWTPRGPRWKRTETRSARTFDPPAGPLSIRLARGPHSATIIARTPQRRRGRGHAAKAGKLKVTVCFS